jgi:hypothetical protein
MKNLLIPASLGLFALALLSAPLRAAEPAPVLSERIASSAAAFLDESCPASEGVIRPRAKVDTGRIHGAARVASAFAVSNNDCASLDGVVDGIALAFEPSTLAASNCYNVGYVQGVLAELESIAQRCASTCSLSQRVIAVVGARFYCGLNPAPASLQNQLGALLAQSFDSCSVAVDGTCSALVTQRAASVCRALPPPPASFNDAVCAPPH